MSRLGTFLKRHRLWVGFLATLVPLIVLLVLQYVWLAKLEETSAIARQATLSNYLEAVATKIEYFYRTGAERSLNVPSTLFARDRARRVAKYFKKKPIKGARELFVVDFLTEQWGSVFFYDSSSHVLVKKEAMAEKRAIYAACVPIRVLSFEGMPVESNTLSVDERDPRHRIIVNPITGDSAQLIAAVGVILDESFFSEVLLPEIIRKNLWKFFPKDADKNLVVTVRDGHGDLVFASSPVEEAEDEVSRPLPFVFTDWRIGIQSRHRTSEQLARANFAINMTLSGLLGVALLGGMIFSIRAASRAMKLSEMKSDFVSNVSHELRTPLASIRVFAEFLRLGRVDREGKIREYGEFIETESRRLTQLINNILDFSRIESDRKTYRFESIDVAEVVRDALKTFEVRLKREGFEIDFSKPDDAMPPIRLDREAIRQALNNLLDNAIKYSGESRRIAVRIAPIDGFITVSVQDFGIGISREEQYKIFERFHRVSTGGVHDVKGSGLGLAIVNHIVEAHHGKVTVDSDPGKGSTFSIHLPLEPVAGTAPEAPDVEPGLEGPEPGLDRGTRESTDR